LSDTLEQYGYPATEESRGIYYRVNRPLWDAFERGEITLDDIFAQRFQRFMEVVGGKHDPIAINRFYVNQLKQHVRVFPGAEEFCRSLFPFCTLAIVTNGGALVQRARLEQSMLLPYFREVFISGEIGYQKPRKEYFDHVCRELSVQDRSRAVIFGDSLTSDMQGGINAGIDTMWFNPKKLPRGEVVPTWEVSDYATAASLILEDQ
jgi:YjjG family noncanonical pyrimidine nucleotidase